MPSLPTFVLAAALLTGSLATEAHAASLDGATLGLPWAMPFVGMLLSIALGPLLTPSFWHHHYGKVAAVWALAAPAVTRPGAAKASRA